MTDTHTRPTITLRAMEPEDLDFIYSLENDAEAWTASTNTVPFSRYLLHDYIANASADIYTDKQVRMIIANSEGTAVGCVDLFDFNPSHMRAEVGIIIHKDHRHNGYAASALSALIGYAATVLHLHQIYAIVNKHNTPSVRLFSNVGFKSGTVLSDWLFDGKEYSDAAIMQFFL